MRMYDIILNKRNGKALSREEIEFLVKGYVDGIIPDYQMSAFLMAVYFQGMNEQETVFLTECMARSGDTVDLSRFGTLSVDKHSSGGVGDKTSLIVAPIVAALGAKVTKMSGRGLGHTGGTIDKLESISGYKTTLTQEQFLSQVEKTGVAVIGQSGNLTPADKKLYALRDVTATVDSIPLITSSIMSKKLAAGSHNIVLDVKVGSGAFMKTPEDAELLATQMVRIGKRCSRNTAALITDMDSPLGNAIGNALEVQEAISVLKGESKGDLCEVCISLASAMISLAFELTMEQARQKVEHTLESGAAFEKMREWIAAQGGDVSYLDDTDKFSKSSFCCDVTAPREGYIAAMNAQDIGIAAVMLGAGRTTKEDTIDPAAGIVLHKKVGASVVEGEVLCTLYSNDEASLSAAQEKFLSCLTFSDTAPVKKPLIYKIIK